MNMRDVKHKWFFEEIIWAQEFGQRLFTRQLLGANNEIYLLVLHNWIRQLTISWECNNCPPRFGALRFRLQLTMKLRGPGRSFALQLESNRFRARLPIELYQFNERARRCSRSFTVYQSAVNSRSIERLQICQILRDPHTNVLRQCDDRHTAH